MTRSTPYFDQGIFFGSENCENEISIIGHEDECWEILSQGNIINEDD